MPRFRLPFPLFIFCQSRRFAAYHEQGQAPAPHVVPTIRVGWALMPDKHKQTPTNTALFILIRHKFKMAGINAQPTFQAALTPRHYSLRLNFPIIRQPENGETNFRLPLA